MDLSESKDFLVHTASLKEVRVFSREVFDKLKLNNNLLSGIIPEIICELQLRWYSEVFLDIFGQPVSSVKDNRLCPPYPSCLNGNYFVNGLGPYSIIGNQNTGNCNWTNWPMLYCIPFPISWITNQKFKS